MTSDEVRPIWSFISGIRPKLALSQDFPAWGNIPMNYLTLRCTDILYLEDKSICMDIVSRYMYTLCTNTHAKMSEDLNVAKQQDRLVVSDLLDNYLQQCGMINHKRAPDIDMFACMLDAFVCFCLIWTKTI